MKAPEEFLKRMKRLLGEEEFVEFSASFELPRFYGLRVNTLKISVEEFLKISPFSLIPIPWTKDGFYYEEGQYPGRHPYYHAGLYYIQEPSAMLPVEVLAPKPGEKILDLCAAPGGKTVQIAAAMSGEGLLIANDISSERVKGLVKNIELYGIKNALVTNDTPQRLAEKFPNYFDKILIDAPCSGEGMLRKDEGAVKGMLNFNTEKCVGMQWEILRAMDDMLKPGGEFVYSTCTFAPEEDEGMIQRFLSEHKNYELLEIPKISGIEGGRPEWVGGLEQVTRTARIWPHRVKGEGHFVARLRKSQLNETPRVIKQDKLIFLKKTETGPFLDEAIRAFKTFEKEYLNTEIEGNFYLKNQHLYLLPVEYPELSGIKVGKFGWYLGEYLHGKFEPSHSFILSMEMGKLKNTYNLPLHSEEVNRYLKGETLMAEGCKGYVGIGVNGYSLGWGKQTGGYIKNLYPKGWRKLN